MAKFLITKAKLISAKQLTDTTYDFTVESKELAQKAQPGQFLHIDCGEKFILRRPISICEILDGGIRFIFDIRGKGTAELAGKAVGDYIDIIGPVGNTFAVSDKKALIIGGGIGIYPLLELAKQISPKAISFGFKSKDFVTLEDEFSGYTDNLYISTDDGSYKNRGNALTPVAGSLEKGEFEAVYACGPLPMLKALKAITDRINVECQISLEERMGCGIGACLCCAVRVEDETDLGYKHLHICKNGPIFNAKEVIFSLGT
jgi:dihydroorotate dehydrogenase electron transfer subunit